MTIRLTGLWRRSRVVPDITQGTHDLGWGRGYALLEPPEFGMDLKMTTASPSICGVAPPVAIAPRLVCDN